MGVSEDPGEHSVWPAGDSAREEHGDLKACRQLLSIRIRLRNATIGETLCMDRVSASTSADPHFGLGSSPRSSSLGEATETATPKKSLECAAVVLDDDADQQQESRSASEADLGLSRRLAGALSLHRKEVMMIMERLFRDHPGAVWRRTSREAIKAVEAQGGEPDSAKVLVYGEISFIAFSKLLEMYAPKTVAPASPGSSLDGKKDSQYSASLGFTFYDLGCGAGRPVFMASLLRTSCVKSCGVEIIPSMHQMNKELQQLYDVEVRKWLHPAKQAQNITFLCGDMLQVDWSDADIVFTNATCFDDVLFGNLEARAKDILKEGAIVIVVTRRFESDSVWELVNQTERRMSWSSAVVSVYRKKTQSLKLPTMAETGN